MKCELSWFLLLFQVTILPKYVCIIVPHVIFLCYMNISNFQKQSVSAMMVFRVLTVLKMPTKQNANSWDVAIIEGVANTQVLNEKMYLSFCNIIAVFTAACLMSIYPE